MSSTDSHSDLLRRVEDLENARQPQLRSGRGNVWGDNFGLQQALDVPRCSLYAVAATGVAAGGGFTAINWDTLEYNTDGMFAAGFPTRITARTQGVYTFKGWVWWTASAVGFRQLAFLKNATTAYADQPSAAPLAGSACGQLISCDIPMNAGDYVELAGAQTTAGALNVLACPSAADRRNGFQACLASTS